jgi:nitrite reductase/ring-hydroxylating ferredoxin subunit
MNWHPVAAMDDIEEGEAISIELNDNRVAIYRINGAFYATQDRCTHGRASLAGGYIEGDCIACPLHDGVFHIPTGKAVSAPATDDLRVYPIKCEDGQVLVLDDQES